MHLAIVDPGVGTERDILLAECDGHMLSWRRITACSPSYSKPAPIRRSYKLDMSKAGKRWTCRRRAPRFTVATYLRPIAAELAAGRITVQDIGTPNAGLDARVDR